MPIRTRLPITFFFLCACASLLVGQSNPTAKGQTATKAPTKAPVVAPPSSVLTFTPPASVGKADEFLSALHSMSEYATYELSDTHAEVQARELSVYVANDVKGFAKTDAPPGIIATGKPLDDQARAQITATLLRSIRAVSLR